MPLLPAPCVEGCVSAAASAIGGEAPAGDQVARGALSQRSSHSRACRRAAAGFRSWAQAWFRQGGGTKVRPLRAVFVHRRVPRYGFLDFTRYERQFISTTLGARLIEVAGLQPALKALGGKSRVRAGQDGSQGPHQRPSLPPTHQRGFHGSVCGDAAPTRRHGVAAHHVRSRARLRAAAREVYQYGKSSMQRVRKETEANTQTENQGNVRWNRLKSGLETNTRYCAC